MRAGTEYWPATRSLVIQTLLGWAFMSYFVPLFVNYLNYMEIFGFPVGFWFPAQGILVFFVAWLFLFVHRQDKIDAACGGGDAVESDIQGFGSNMAGLVRVYGVYTLGFVVFVCFLGVLEAASVSERVIGILFLVFTLLLYGAIGIMMHTQNAKDYFVAGQVVPPVFNGMATAADWMSGASFVAMAGGIYAKGYDYLAFVVGWTGGYILVATLVAPYLRRYECYTVASFVRDRYQGKLTVFGRDLDLSTLAGLFAIVVSLCCSFTYLVAQVYSSGLIMSYFTGLQLEEACWIGLVGVLVCSMLGGMKAVTWTQVAQYIILIVAYILPCVLMSASIKDGFNSHNPIPQLAYGGALQESKRTGEKLIEQGLAAAKDIDYMTSPKETSRHHFLFLSFCLMCGTAGLPHILMRYFTARSVKGARKSVAWSLFFIFLLYVTAPAYATYAKREVFTNVVGKTLDQLPSWVYKYGDIKLTKICKHNVASVSAAVEACNATSASSYQLKMKDLSLKSDAVVICTPEIAGLPYTIAGLVAAGGLAAALSTADGLLLAITNALAHDVYKKIIDPNATPFRLLVISRSLLLVVAAGAAAAAVSEPGDILSLVAWAFSMAGSGNFPAIVLGIWWDRANVYGCIAGQVLGFGITLLYLIGSKYAEPPWDWGVQNLASGVFGIPLGFLANVVVSLLTPPPSAENRQMVADIRHKPRFKSDDAGAQLDPEVDTLDPEADTLAKAPETLDDQAQCGPPSSLREDGCGRKDQVGPCPVNCGCLPVVRPFTSPMPATAQAQVASHGLQSRRP